MSTDFLDNPFRPSNSVFEPDPWLDQFNQLWYDYFNDRDPADDFDDFDRIEREQEANRLVDLLEAYHAGTIGYEQFMAEYNTGSLFDEIPGFDDWLEESRNAVQYDSMLNDWAVVSKSGDPQAIQDFVSLYNRTGIQGNPLVQADLASTGSAVSVITGTVDNSILEDFLRKEAIGDGILGGEVDFEDLPGYGGIWDGLIRHIKVIGRGINLPIPDWLPLPGIFELPTIGEIFDTVTGPWKEAAQDALRDCMAGPDGTAGTADDKAASVCMEEQSVIDILVDGIGNATEGIWEATKDKVNDIFGEEGIIDRCTSDPSGCAQEVFDKLKDIFGEGAVDPTSTGGNIPDWMKVIIIGGAYGDEILGELEDLFGGDINDDGTIGVGPEEPEECTNGAVNYPQCDQCPQGQQLENGQCVDIPPWENTGPSPQDCSSQNRSHIPADPATQTPSSCGECLTGFEEVGDQCQEEEDPITNNGPTAAECAAENREFNPATDVEDSSCGPCLSGFREEGDVCVEDTGPEECSNGAVDPGTCAECEDGSTPDQHQGGNCNNPLIDPNDPFNCAAGRPEGGYSFETQSWDRNCSADYCYNGTPKQTVDGVYGANCEEYVAPQPQEGDPCDSTGDGQNDGTIVNGECVPTTTGEVCDNGATNYPDCDQCPDGQSLENGQCVGQPQECDNGATVESGCEQCPQGFTFDFNGICKPDSGFSCDDYNRTTNEDGTCGPCKEGYEIDTSLPNEPCVKIFDGCPPGFELVNGQCTAIVCPEGQSYCIDTDGCVDIGTCPSDPPEEEGGDDAGGGGGGAGGGGGGRSMFEPYSFAVSADPQLLSRSEFPITDFLAGIFTNSTGGRNV